MARFRSLKPKVQAILDNADQHVALEALGRFTPREIIGPLFSLLLAPSERIRWRAVTALGATVAGMARVRMEDARVVMRRFMWHMNEESGNIGWGIPEAMAESMARHEGLAREFHKVLGSYVQCPECALGDDNFLDHPPLRLGVYWGLGRLAEERPGCVAPVVGDLLRSLQSEGSPMARGLICRALGRLGAASAVEYLKPLAQSPDELELYRGWSIEQTTLGALASEALATLEHTKEQA